MVEDKGVKILVEPKALMHVIGTKMDFVDDKLRYYRTTIHLLMNRVSSNVFYLHAYAD